MSKRKAVDEDLEEFEEQITQQRVEDLKTSDSDSILASANLRRDPDGTLYEFDAEKNAWFPKIDDNFIATYQMNYGCGVSTDQSDQTAATADQAAVQLNEAAAAASTNEQLDESFWTNPPDINSPEYADWYSKYCQYYSYYYGQDPQQVSSDAIGSDSVQGAESTDATANGKKGEKIQDKSKKPPQPTQPPTWFQMDDEKNTSVYVTGLPDKITETEYNEFMNKAGLIAYDPVLRKPKIKLCRNADGTIKGDGRCTYIKGESVTLALQILDDALIHGSTVAVQRAKFELKGEYDPTKKRRKLTNREKKKFKEKQDKLLSWQLDKPEDARPRWEKTVVIKNLFKPADMEANPLMYGEISSDVRDECSKYGDVRKVIVYDRNAEGVAMVTFRTAEEADACIGAVNDRWFGGVKLEAAAWDGKTKYLVEESEEQMSERLNQWHHFLETDEDDRQEGGGAKNNSASNTASNSATATTTTATEVTNNEATTSGEATTATTSNNTTDATVTTQEATITETIKSTDEGREEMTLENF